AIPGKDILPSQSPAKLKMCLDAMPVRQMKLQSSLTITKKRRSWSTLFCYWTPARLKCLISEPTRWHNQRILNYENEYETLKNRIFRHPRICSQQPEGNS